MKGDIDTPKKNCILKQVGVLASFRAVWSIYPVNRIPSSVFNAAGGVSGDIPSTIYAAIGDIAMTKIRVPESQTANFKDFCKRFSRNLELACDIRLRGNKLLNTMAKAAGHNHYKDLLMDSATYGNGPFDWDTLPVTLAKPLSILLDTLETTLWKALVDAVLVEPDAISEINEKIKNSFNPLAAAQPKLLSPSVGNNQFGRIFDASPADVDLLDIVSQNDTPVIDLAPLHSLSNTYDKMNLLRTIVRQFLSMDEFTQSKVIFLGDKSDIELMLQVDPAASVVLRNNPSIKAHGIGHTIAKTDISELAGANSIEVGIVKENTHHHMFIDPQSTPWADEDSVRMLNLGRSEEAQNQDYFTLGERFAGRQRPPGLVTSIAEIESFIDKVKSELEPVMPNTYDLQAFANCIYFKLQNTSDYSSLDLGGWLLDNGRKLGVALSRLQEPLN